MRTDVSKPTVCRIESSGLSLSAVRLMDHVLYGQVLPFDMPLAGQLAWERPEAFVDLCFLGSLQNSYSYAKRALNSVFYSDPINAPSCGQCATTVPANTLANRPQKSSRISG